MHTLYQTYFEHIPCYLSVHDPEFHIIEANQRFREDFGDRLGDYCYRMYKQRQEVCPDCPVQATFKDGYGHSSEQLLRTRHGKSVQVMVNTTPIRNHEGVITSVMEMHTDIGDLKRLQRELERSQARAAQLFEEVPCFLTVQDQDLVIRNANRRFKETFGPAIGTECYRVYKHRDEPCLVCPARKALAEGTIQKYEEVVTSKTGEEMNMLCRTRPLVDEEGARTEVIKMSTDITQIRALQSQLTSIGLLVGSISHGIKGLLQGLDGGIYLVNTGFDKQQPDRVKKGWAMIQRNVGRIRSMVMDILYYAKDRELILEEISPTSMMEEIRAELTTKACDVGAELRLDVAAEVGTLQADAMAVRALLLNIIENSLDACRADSEKTEHLIELVVRREPPMMLFEINDNGIGMDQETCDKVFSLFFSSKGTKGTGLGLFIANKIADKHGGNITVESRPGCGTRFCVRLPLEARPSVPPSEGEATTEGAKATVATPCAGMQEGEDRRSK